MLPIRFFQPIPAIHTSSTHVLSQISLVVTSTELPRTALARKFSASMIHRQNVQTAMTSTAGRGWSACVSTIQRSLSLVQFLHVGLRGGFGLSSWNGGHPAPSNLPLYSSDKRTSSSDGFNSPKSNKIRYSTCTRGNMDNEERLRVFP